MIKKPSLAEIVLYSSPNCLRSHAIRFIIKEKNLDCDIQNVTFEEIPEEFIALNPTQTMPMLFDRGLLVYDVAVIMEYLDERFPFPTILPVNPIDKAERRMLIYHLTRAKDNWYDLIDTMLHDNNKRKVNAARKIMTNNLIDLALLFAYKPFFKSDVLGAADIFLAPALWRLKSVGIDLNIHNSILEYANKIFALKSFKKSLTYIEKELR